MLRYDKNSLYIKFVNENNRVECIKNPIYVMHQVRNNITISCHKVHAQGVVSSDGSTIYQFEDKPIMDPSYHVVKTITYAEFCEAQPINGNDDIDDPEISDEEALSIILGDITE